LLEKEIEKKKSKDLRGDLDKKMQIKDLQIKLS
jgi:hypothetical protein